MAYETASTIRKWLKDNPGYHFTDDVLDGCVAANPAIPRRSYRVTLYQLERARFPVVEIGGSSATRKWRYKQ